MFISSNEFQINNSNNNNNDEIIEYHHQIFLQQKLQAYDCRDLSYVFTLS